MSILHKLMVPLVLITLIQSAVFYAAVRFGGTVTQLSRNSYDLFNERVASRTGVLENEMIQRWSNIEKTGAELEGRLEALGGDERISGDALAQDDALASAYLASAADEIIYLLKRNSVTGAFVILGEDDSSTDTEKIHSGLYIRDMDPDSASEDNADLLVEAAPPSLTRQLKIPMDSFWTPQITFQENEPGYEGNFFYKPWGAALENPGVEPRDLGYWSPPFRLTEKGIDVVTYSIPLLDSGGTPFGVMGIELSVDHLRRILPYAEIDSAKRGAYLLAVDSGGQLEFQNVLTSGPVYKELYGEADLTRFAPAAGYAGSRRILDAARSNDAAVGCIHYLQLYNTNTPFIGERWALIGIMRERDLLEMVDRVNALLFASLAGSLLLGVAGAFFVGARFTRPVSFLVRKLRESDPEKPVRLEQLYITEIDELSGAIEHLSTSVADSASRLTQLIELSDIALGAFEYDRRVHKIFYAGKLFRTLGIAEARSGYMTVEQFRERMTAIRPALEESRDHEQESVYRVELPAGGQLWLRLKIVCERDRRFGAIVDVTRDVAERRKIEYERDYDLLTSLLNRRAFYAGARRRFEDPGRMGTAALIMLDLDNLKYVNDTYGHDYGDAYIRSAAGVLRRLTVYDALVSRMSGDEFLVLISGRGDKGELRAIIDELRENMRAAVMPLPDGEEIRIRASAGVAFYPDDADSLDLLVKYADFAMYKVKNTEKGEFSEFSINSYNREAYLLHAREELNKLIDGELVDYAFQPIVDARTGEVHAFEALMRPQLDTLSSPFEVLTLARAQSQLHRIERLTWFKALRDFSEREQEMPKSMLFLNSIPNQHLSREDIARCEELYGPLLGRVVIELTEEEKIDESALAVKKDCAARWGTSFAIDDFGTGYNGEALLLGLTPQYVKVDISIIRGIDGDPDRQRIFSNLISYAHERGMRIVAEGVETQGELDAVVVRGVDFIQGYYLGRPKNVLRPLAEEAREALALARERAEACTGAEGAASAPPR